MRRALALALICMATPALAGRVPTEVCSRDLFQAEGGLRASHGRMTDAASKSETEKCAVWRQHVDALRFASGVFGRCLTGDEKAARIAQTEQDARDFTRILTERCGKPK
jgi:hypothetical protein